HGFFRVGDDDKLRPLEEFSEDGDEAFNVGFVECGVDFVEHAEGTGTTAKDCQQEGDASESFFAAGKKRNTARLLAGGPSNNFDAAFQDVDPFFQNDVGLTATKQFAEQLLEMAADGFQGFGEEAAAVGVDAGDDLLERALGFGEIFVL